MLQLNSPKNLLFVNVCYLLRWSSWRAGTLGFLNSTCFAGSEYNQSSYLSGVPVGKKLVSTWPVTKVSSCSFFKKLACGTLKTFFHTSSVADSFVLLIYWPKDCELLKYRCIFFAIFFAFSIHFPYSPNYSTLRPNYRFESHPISRYSGRVVQEHY